MAITIQPRSLASAGMSICRRHYSSCSALFLCGLVLLPLGWLGWYSITDQDGALTLANFVAPGDRSDLRRPVPDGARDRGERGRRRIGIGHRRSPGWSPAPTCRCGGAIRALVTASFVTPPFLGAIAWEILAAPNSGILNQWYRALFGLDPYEHLSTSTPRRASSL